MFKSLLIIALLSFPQAHAASVDRPDEVISRAEAAVLIVREFFEDDYIDSFAQTRFFEDVSSDDWYAGAFGVLHQHGVWNKELYVLPHSGVNKEEFLEALYIITKHQYPVFAEDKPLSADVEQGTMTHAIFSDAVAMHMVEPIADTLTPYDSITRAQAADIVEAYTQFQDGKHIESAKSTFWKEVSRANEGNAAASYRAILLIKGMLYHREDPEYTAMQRIAWAVGKKLNGDAEASNSLLSEAQKIDSQIYQVFRDGAPAPVSLFQSKAFLALLVYMKQLVPGAFMLP